MAVYFDKIAPAMKTPLKTAIGMEFSSPALTKNRRAPRKKKAAVGSINRLGADNQKAGVASKMRVVKKGNGVHRLARPKIKRPLKQERIVTPNLKNQTLSPPTFKRNARK